MTSRLKALPNPLELSYRCTTVQLVIFESLNFHGLGSRDDFGDLYFHSIPTLLLNYITKIQLYSMDKKTQEILENLNLTKFTNHTVLSIIAIHNNNS